MATVRPGSKFLIREINEALILDVLRLRETVARTELATLTGLSPATVTGITARLIDTGLVFEVSRGPSTGGRPPRMLALNPAGGHVIGAWLTDDRIVAVTINLVGEVIDEHSVPRTGTDAHAAEDDLAELAETLRTRSTAPIMGMGLTVSGIVDHDTGVIRHSGQLGWEDVALGPALADRLGIPVLVDKLVNALASALLLFGEGRGMDDLVVVSIGYSIGLGLVLNGHVHRGAAGSAGSLAHTAVSVLGGPPPGGDRPCHCGARGCLETVASEWAIRRDLAEIGFADIDTAAAHAGAEDRVRPIFATAGRALGGAVANLAKVISPQRIILGGEGTRLGAPLLEPLRKELHRAMFSSGGDDVDLHVIPTDGNTWAHGAACQSLTELFRVSQSGVAQSAQSGVAQSGVAQSGVSPTRESRARLAKNSSA